MAQILPIFQPVLHEHRHVDRLVSMAGEPWLTKLIISSAFANAVGVAAVSDALRPVAARCQAFIGVRNGSTTAQALMTLLSLGVRLYAVDTAMRARIFHPKLYLAKGADQAIVIIGSANLTHAGLHNNIEASAELLLDRTDPSDRAFLVQFLAGFQRLIDDFPEHCVAVTSGRQIVEMMREGLLEDERQPRAETALGAGQQGAKTSKPRIGLPFTVPAKTKKKKARKPKPPQAVPGVPMSAMPHYGQLVWAKPNVPEGDLQLLKVGHISGVLRLTQARYEVDGHKIDHTTYFRNDVFGQLAWTYDQVAQKEVAVAPVSLIVAGVYVGDFDLRLSHKPAWEAGQGNYTTGLHWHDATDHIRKPGLVGRTLRLFEPALPGGRFVIEID